MKYKVFVEARDIVFIESDSKEKASHQAIMQAADAAGFMEWSAEVVEESE